MQPWTRALRRMLTTATRQQRSAIEPAPEPVTMWQVETWLSRALMDDDQRRAVDQVGSSTCYGWRLHGGQKMTKRGVEDRVGVGLQSKARRAAPSSKDAYMWILGSRVSAV